MSFFHKAEDPYRPKSRVAFLLTQLAAGALTIVALAQLFMFEDFPAVLLRYSLPSEYLNHSLLASALVTLEVFGAAYFLMIRLSPLMRIVSWACVVLCCIAWTVMGVYLLIIQENLMNSGLLGATISLQTGWPALLFSLILLTGLIVMPLRLKSIRDTKHR